MTIHTFRTQKKKDDWALIVQYNDTPIQHETVPIYGPSPCSASYAQVYDRGDSRVSLYRDTTRIVLPQTIAHNHLDIFHVPCCDHLTICHFSFVVVAGI